MVIPVHTIPAKGPAIVVALVLFVVLVLIEIRRD